MGQVHMHIYIYNIYIQFYIYVYACAHIRIRAVRVQTDSIASELARRVATVARQKPGSLSGSSAVATRAPVGPRRMALRFR